jgi:hypothetical protein
MRGLLLIKFSGMIQWSASASQSTGSDARHFRSWYVSDVLTLPVKVGFQG